MRGALPLALALLCAPACKDLSQTQVMLVVRSDLAVPGEIDRIEVKVQGMQSTAPSTADLNQIGLPRTLSLVHDGGDSLGPVVATVEGWRGTTLVVSRAARFSFQREQVRRLDIFLARACVAVPCSGETTCTEGGSCVDIDEATPALKEWTGKPAQRPDAGTDAARPPLPDAGKDAAAPDAAEPDAQAPPRDGGMDAATADAGALDCTDPDNNGQACDDGQGCTIDDSCTMGRCQGVSDTCDMSGKCDTSCDTSCDCGVDCGLSSNCNTSCTGGGSCHMRCGLASNCDLSCSGGSDCSMDCTNTSNCSASCSGGSTCSILCTLTTNNCKDIECSSGSDCFIQCHPLKECSFSSCSQTVMSCPGNIIACSSACP